MRADVSCTRLSTNGNIAHTVNALAPFGGYPDATTAPGQVLAMSYRYDQLNRLKEARGFVGLDADNDWALAGSSPTDLYKSLYSYDANGNIESAQRWDQDATPQQYDNLQYSYHDASGYRVRNRLYNVTDNDNAGDAQVSQAADGFEDYPNQTSGPETNMQVVNTSALSNYHYDELGNLVSDQVEHIAAIDWTLAGKVRSVDQVTGHQKKDLLFRYGADGQRVVKDVLDETGTTLEQRDYYIRDAQGNIMAIYRTDDPTSTFKVKERPMYGSSRVGVDNYELELCALDLDNYDELNDPPGDQRFELTDHLGNVTSVLTDELLGVNTDGNPGYEYFQPHAVGAQGYEPFGSLLPGRNYNSGSTRYGFNGKENDNEVHGAVGTFQDYGFRMYDTRIARFISVDPLAAKFPMLTPYQFASNNPIRLIDIDGLEGGEPPRNDGNTVLTTEVSGGVINRVYTTTTTTPDFTYKMGETIRTRREERVGTVNPDGTFTFEIEVQFREKSTQLLNPGQVTEQIRALEGDIQRLGGASSIRAVGFTKGVPWAAEKDPNPQIGMETMRHPEDWGNDGQPVIDPANGRQLWSTIPQNEVSRNIQREQGAITWGSWLDLGQYRAEAVKGMLSGENQANTTAVPNTNSRDTDNDRRATLIVTPATP